MNKDALDKLDISQGNVSTAYSHSTKMSGSVDREEQVDGLAFLALESSVQALVSVLLYRQTKVR